jgi:hypothetical protein
MKAAARDGSGDKLNGIREIVGQIVTLTERASALHDGDAFGAIRAEPIFQALFRDLKFPGNPFAPPS